MEQTKPTLTSKTVLIALAVAIINALVFFGIIPTDLGLGALLAGSSNVTLANVIAAIAAIWTRKTATAKLV